MYDVNEPAGSRAGLKEWVGLAIIALPTLLVSIDVSVMVLALPQISESLGADSAQQLWIMDIYSFMLAGFMITMGTLGDRIGRRKLLMIGGAAFGLASVVAAFAPTAMTLIAARALLGIAGATISPSILALITNMFRDGAQRGLAISIWMVCFMAGMTLGPLVGGVMLEHFWWGAPFLLGVPVMVLLLATGPFLLPEYKDSSPGRLDLMSVGLSLLTILPVVYGLKEAAKDGVTLVAVVTVLVGLGFGLLFIRRQRRLAHPLLDVSLFSNRAFRAAVGGMFLITVTGSLMIFNSQYLQLVLGLSPLEVGLWTLPGVIGMAGMLMLAPVIAQHVPQGRLIAAGLIVGAFGAAMLTFATPANGVVWVVVGFFFFNLGCAPMVTLANGIVLGVVQPERAGAAAALSETCSELGFALGIAFMGSLGTLLYRAQLEPALSGLPVETASAARDTLAGAIVAASGLPADQGGVLLDAAQSAFLQGFHVVSWVCAVALLTVALIAIVQFRGLPKLGAEPTAQPA